MKLKNTVIDSHIHISEWFAKDGESYIQKLDSLQSQTGLSGLCIDSLTDEIYGGIHVNVMAAIYKLHNPSAFAYANLYFPKTPVTLPFPDGLSPEEQYIEFKKIGFDGIKILYKPDLQKKVVLPINDPCFDEFFTLAERDKTHFIWHVADPKSFWSKDCEQEEWNYSDGTFPTFDEMFEQTFDVLNKHPLLNVCFAHFMFMENTPERLEEIFKKYPNVCVDVVPGLMFRAFEKRPEYFKEFLTTHSDRILFGSDSEIPTNSHCSALINAICDGLATDDTVNIWGYRSKGLKLPTYALKNILSENFKRVCHPAPTPINKSALKEYIKKYRPYFTPSIETDEIEKFEKTI